MREQREKWEIVNESNIENPQDCGEVCEEQVSNYVSFVLQLHVTYVKTG